MRSLLHRFGTSPAPSPPPVPSRLPRVRAELETILSDLTRSLAGSLPPPMVSASITAIRTGLASTTDEKLEAIAEQVITKTGALADALAGDRAGVKLPPGEYVVKLPPVPDGAIGWRQIR